MLVYALPLTDTFGNLESWVKELKDGVEAGTPIFVLGNKKDLVAERRVSLEEGEAFVTQNGLSGFYEVSAVTGENIPNAFTALAAMMLDRALDKLRKTQRRKKDAITIDKKRRDTAVDLKKEKKGCC